MLPQPPTNVSLVDVSKAEIHYLSNYITAAPISFELHYSVLGIRYCADVNSIQLNGPYWRRNAHSTGQICLQLFKGNLDSN